MTLVGKTMTLLILVMSIMFMAIAAMNYGTQRNYKELVNGTNGQAGLQQQLNDTRQKIQQREAEAQTAKAQLAFEQATRRSALIQLEIRANELNRELKASRDRYIQATDVQRKNNETVANAQTEMKRLMDRVEELQSEVSTELTNRKTSLERVKQITDQMNLREGDLRRLQTRNRQFSGLRN